MAIIEIKAGRYFSAMWFVPGDNVDWMCALWKDPTVDNNWHIVYRFRYYDSPDAWDQKDRKSVTEACAPVDKVTEEQALAQCNKLANATAGMFGTEVHKLILRTDKPEDIMTALNREDWAHSKVMPKEAEGEPPPPDAA